MSERNEWLANLKPGDEVGRQMGGGWGTYLHVDFLTVKRRTAKYIFIGSVNNKTYEQKFRASDGREPGNGMYVLSVPTDELKKQFADQARKAELLKIMVIVYLTQGSGKRIIPIKWFALPCLARSALRRRSISKHSKATYLSDKCRRRGGVSDAKVRSRICSWLLRDSLGSPSAIWNSSDHACGPALLGPNGSFHG